MVKDDIGLERIVNIKLGFNPFILVMLKMDGKAIIYIQWTLATARWHMPSWKNILSVEEHFKNTNTILFMFKTTWCLRGVSLWPLTLREGPRFRLLYPLFPRKIFLQSHVKQVGRLICLFMFLNSLKITGNLRETCWFCRQRLLTEADIFEMELRST